MPPLPTAYAATHGPRRQTLARLALAWLLPPLSLVATPAEANRLQVSPTLIEIAANRPAEAIWLSNPGKQPVPIQVRVFRWDQTGAEERLDPTDELIVSPSQIVIPPGQRQLIRILRQQQAPDTEQGYRVIVDELAGLAATDEVPKGLQFRLRYSIPVFVAPGRPLAEPGPRLVAALHRDATTKVATLEVDNHGGGRARLAEALLLAPGKPPIELSPGLLGYVLSRQSMRWPVEAVDTAADAARSKPMELRVRVNSEATPRLIPVRVIDAR